MSNPHKTCWKLLHQKIIIFTKFHEDWTKKCGFFTNVQILNVSRFFGSDFNSLKKEQNKQSNFTIDWMLKCLMLKYLVVEHFFPLFTFDCVSWWRVKVIHRNFSVTSLYLHHCSTQRGNHNYLAIFFSYHQQIANQLKIFDEKKRKKERKIASQLLFSQA